MRAEPKFFYLNIGDRWPEFRLTDLEIAPDGALQLRALPRLVGRLPENLGDLATPQRPAGIARTGDGALFFTDPGQHRLWRIDSCDPEEMPRPAACLGGRGSEAGQFKSPRGLLFLPGRGLVVADSGNHRLQIIDPLTGQVGDIWGGLDENGQPLLHRPWALAADSAGNVYVVVAGDRSLQKIDRLGRIDPEFRATLDAGAALTEPVAVAVATIDGEEYVLALDRALRAVVVYTLTGQWQKTFTADVLQIPLAMVASTQALYIGNSGQGVLQFDLPRLADDRLNFAGMAVGYQGPVAALFVDRADATAPPWCAVEGQIEPPAGEQPGYVLLLPGNGLAPIFLQEGMGYGTCGFAVAGPFDYRRRPVSWHRLQALMEALPPHGHARFFFFLGEPPANAPPETLADWLAKLPPAFDPCQALAETLANWCAFPVDAGDGLFGSVATAECASRPAPANNGDGSPGDPATVTYLWLGLMLSGGGTATPRLHQIRLQFNHRSYLPHLPALYSENESSRQFLLPLLSLFESFLAEQEAVIANLPALFDPAAAPAEFLGWLAEWLGQDLQEAWADERKRHMIATAFAAYARRGTAAGLRSRLQQFAGVQAHILEPVLHTHLWSLGEASTLGVDTMLASAQPGGAVLSATATLDQSHLIADDEFGAPLFEEVAHQFAVHIYRGQVNSPEKEAEVRRIVERDKPAHTDYHLCFVEPRMRVGFQARVGIDTLVAGPPQGLRLGDELSQQRALGGPAAGSIGERSQVGVSTRIY